MKLVIFVSQNHVLLSGLCIQYAKNIQGIGEKILVITPDVTRARNFYNFLGIDNIELISDLDVCKVLNVPDNKLNWVTKQYAILNLDKFVSGDTFVNLDADVICNTTLNLAHGDQRTFYLECEYFAPYFQTIFDFFAITKTLPINESFISDFMIFDRQYLMEMRDSSLAFSSYTSWREIVNKNSSKTMPAISEYETYGTWMHAHYPTLVVLDRTSSTYDDNMKFYQWQPTKENLDQQKTIIPLRSTRDDDIDWSLIYNTEWENFKL